MDRKSRRKRKLVKSDLPKSSVSPYLEAPEPLNGQHLRNRPKPKRRRKIRRKNPIGQRRKGVGGRANGKRPFKSAPRSLAYKIHDGLNRVARWSSEIILYTTLIGLT